MGFLNWMMSGLGFESENKKKEVQTTVQEKDKYANFNFNSTTKQEDNSAPSNYSPFGMQMESNVVACAPKNKKDVEAVVDYLRQGQVVTVDLSGISAEDTEPILNFISGALYGLNGSILRLKGDMFLLTPEGKKIYQPEDRSNK